MILDQLLRVLKTSEPVTAEVMNSCMCAPKLRAICWFTRQSSGAVHIKAKEDREKASCEIKFSFPILSEMIEVFTHKYI